MESKLDAVQITIKPNAVARFLGAVVVLIVIASVTGQIFDALFDTSQFHVFGWRPIELVNLAGEENIPTAFSVFLLFSSSTLLAFISFIKKEESKISTFYWMVLSLGFLFMAADEGWQIHEGLIFIFRRWMGTDSYGIFYYAWVIPYAIIVVFFTVFFSIFLARLRSETRNAFLIAAALFVGGALGLEMLEGYYDELHGSDNFIYSMMQTVEECLEMTGIIIFIWALLKEIANDVKEIRFITPKT